MADRDDDFVYEFSLEYPKLSKSFIYRSPSSPPPPLTLCSLCQLDSESESEVLIFSVNSKIVKEAWVRDIKAQIKISDPTATSPQLAAKTKDAPSSARNKPSDKSKIIRNFQ